MFNILTELMNLFMIQCIYCEGMKNNVYVEVAFQHNDQHTVKAATALLII